MTSIYITSDIIAGWRGRQLLGAACLRGASARVRQSRPRPRPRPRPLLRQLDVLQGAKLWSQPRLSGLRGPLMCDRVSSSHCTAARCPHLCKPGPAINRTGPRQYALTSQAFTKRSATTPTVTRLVLVSGFARREPCRVGRDRTELNLSGLGRIGVRRV